MVPSFYVDDRFPEHPKAIAAGDDACWLFICGLAYVRRNNVTVIPKPVAPRLVARNGPKLVKRLCDVNLWHDRGTFYEIHDYETRNAKQLAKSVQARKAADTRWQRVAEQTREQSDSNADAMRTHVHEHNGSIAEHMPVRVAEPCIQISSSSSSPHPHRPPPGEHGDDDENSSNRTITTQAVQILAARALATTPTDVHNTSAWLAKTAGQKLEEHRKTLAGLDLGAFETPDDLADHLEPPRSRTRPDRTQVAAQRIAAESDLEPCPKCHTRGGAGWVPADDGNGVMRCPECTPQPSRVAS